MLVDRSLDLSYDPVLPRLLPVALCFRDDVLSHERYVSLEVFCIPLRVRPDYRHRSLGVSPAFRIPSRARIAEQQISINCLLLHNIFLFSHFKFLSTFFVSRTQIIGHFRYQLLQIFYLECMQIFMINMSQRDFQMLFVDVVLQLILKTRCER